MIWFFHLLHSSPLFFVWFAVFLLLICKGQQHHSYTDHYDEEPHTTVTVDKMLVSFHRDSSQPTSFPAIRGQGSSSRNDAVPNSVVAFSPSDAEQMSGSHLSAQLDLGKYN